MDHENWATNFISLFQITKHKCPFNNGQNNEECNKENYSFEARKNDPLYSSYVYQFDEKQLEREFKLINKNGKM